MTPRHRTLGRRCAALALGLATVGMLALAPATEATTSFPVPHCSWASTGLIRNDLGLRVTAPVSKFSVRLSPVLDCAYAERTPDLQASGHSIIAIEYLEQQHFQPRAGFVFVPGLGSCVADVSCPKPGESAFIAVSRRSAAGSAYAMPYLTSATLWVEDGLNAVAVEVNTPNGPLATHSSEQAAIVKLVRAILPRFYWR